MSRGRGHAVLPIPPDCHATSRRHKHPRRHLHGDVPPTGAAGFPPDSHTQPPRGAPPRGASDHETGQGFLLLAQDGEGYSGGGTCLHGLPARKSTQTREAATRTHPSASPPILTPTHRLGRPSSKIRRLYTSIYYHRQDHQMAGSCASLRHLRRRLRSRPLLRMGTTIRAASGDHQRQGSSVYISGMGGPLQTSQHTPHTHHRLSSAGKWAGGKVSSPTERRPASKDSRRQLVITPTLGNAGN